MDCSDSDEIFFLNKLECLLLFENESNVTHVAKEDAVSLLLDECCGTGICSDHDTAGLKQLCHQFLGGQYADILRGEVVSTLLLGSDAVNNSDENDNRLHFLHERLSAYREGKAAIVTFMELEIVGAAALNLFLQLNYTGPSMELSTLDDINPHNIFIPSDEKDGDDTASHTPHNRFHSFILSKLAVDGELPCQVCEGPYFLYLARIIFLHLAHPTLVDMEGSYLSWTLPGSSNTNTKKCSFSQKAGTELQFVHLWSARAAVAHQRLLNPLDPSETLWKEINHMFQHIERTLLATPSHWKQDHGKLLAQVMLEWGLAQHHFNRKGRGRDYFRKAQEYSGLEVDLTGSKGKRTKYQQQSTAQLLVRTKNTHSKMFTTGNGHTPPIDTVLLESNAAVIPTMIPHSDEEILLEKVQYENDEDNSPDKLSPLDQSILLSLCLNVKNNNPLDGLTAEEMGAYLERVLVQHDDWMIFSTALLERAWLECEKVHGRERAILQIQALVDQHSRRLTLTQSTFKSIEDEENFAPVQKRLANLHTLVYPPLWEIKADLATRYARIGIVTTAAEIFESLGMFPEAVECYQRASKLSKAETIVRSALKTSQTPRMWLALGDITKDPSCYEKAIELSKGRFSSAFVALGKHCSENGDLLSASEYIGKSLVIKPLNPGLWFFFGTINMKLEEWDVSLKSFSEVVQQEPEEGEAWANIAAIHMKKHQPEKAYPALVEALKQNRNNWRMWWSKLFVCLDLRKYDEAILSCNQLMDLRIRMNMEASVPLPEERCIRGLVGGTLKALNEAKASNDVAAMESSNRTIDRVTKLLDRLSSVTSEPWIWQVSAYFNHKLDRAPLILDDLQKEYRSLLTKTGWETDTAERKSVVNVALQICAIHHQDGSKESCAKANLMLNSLIKRIKTHYIDTDTIPEEVSLLEEEVKEATKRDISNDL